MLVHLLAEIPAPSPDHTSMVTVVVALCAALPGLLGIWYTWRKARKDDEEEEGAVGLGFAKAAFYNMEHEVSRLAKQAEQYAIDRDAWDRDRKAWADDKGRLLSKIAELTEQLHQTNVYLQVLLGVLDTNDISPPAPPRGYRTM